MTLRTDSMEVAGEVLQDLCANLGISELEASAHFPLDMEEFRHVLLQVSVTHATPYGDSFWLRIGRLGFVWHGATESGP